MLEEQVSRTLMPGMHLPEPIKALFAWIEARDLYIDRPTGARIVFLYPEAELRHEVVHAFSALFRLPPVNSDVRAHNPRMRTHAVIGSVLAFLCAVYFIFIERWVPEDASWFGRTGLEMQVERELPKYLRREFGQSWLSNTYVQASDLEYLGSFKEGVESVHYWKIPFTKGAVYAYVISRGSGRSMGWGGTRQPPAPTSQ